MIGLPLSSAEECNLLDPNACGLYDCGGNSWSPDETQGNGDNLSLKSGQVNMIGASRLCMKVHGPGLVKFVWQVDPTPYNVGTLTFWIGGSKVLACDSRSWSNVSYSLRENREYDMSWQFQKIKSYPECKGAGWLDDLEIIVKNTDTLFGISSLLSNESQKDNTSNLNHSANCSFAKFYMPRCSCMDGKDNISNENYIAYPPVQSPTIVPPLNITINNFLYSTNTCNMLIPFSSINLEKDLNKTLSIPSAKNNKTNKSSEVYVSKNKSKQLNFYDSINEAVKAVNDHGNVTIYAGKYNESIIIDKNIRLNGMNNSSTTIVVKGQDGITVCCEDGSVFIENISIINEDSTGKSTIGINILSKSKNVNISIKNCIISNFTFGTRMNEQNLIFVGNMVNSFMEFNNIDYDCTLCTKNDLSVKDKNYTVGLWFNSPNMLNPLIHI